MDQQRLTTWTSSVRSLPSRRDVLRGLAGAGLGLGSLRLSNDVVAEKHTRKLKKDKKKKRSQAVVNQYGCLNVGQPCRGDSTRCCSGICQGAAPKKGKPDTSRCVAHNTSICKVTSDSCTTGLPVRCHATDPYRICLRTTGNAGFCAENPAGEPRCRNCRRDTDCQAEFGPGAACVVLGGLCTTACLATGRTACLRPCA